MQQILTVFINREYIPDLKILTPMSFESKNVQNNDKHIILENIKVQNEK